MELSLYEILSGMAMTLYLLRCWLTKTFDYWRKRKVAGPRPIPIFGSFRDVLLNRVHAADYEKLIYDTYPAEPAVGLFSRSLPLLLIRDANMIKDVLHQSFATFPNRALNIHEDMEPLGQHLMFLQYKRWKPLRTKWNRIFSSAKLTEMLALMDDCSEHFIAYMQNLVTKDEAIECRKLTAEFVSNVIAVCAFGMNIHAVPHQFTKIARQIFADSWINQLRYIHRMLPRWMAVVLQPVVSAKKMIAFLVDTVKKAIESRKANGTRRNDFLDSLIDIKDNPEQVGHAKTSDTFLAAQAFVFFVAGFHTTATTMSNLMYELALNPAIQQQLRLEVEAAYEASNGKLAYETLRNMNYLEQVLQETLRKYPPVYHIIREAADDHMFQASKILITKGTKVLIPTYAIHHDPDIYPEPEKFNPDRFTDEAVQSRHPMCFLAFSHGPRACIGEQFARMQMKLAMAAALKNFQFEVCKKTSKVYNKSMRCSFLLPKGELYLKIKKVV